MGSFLSSGSTVGTVHSTPTVDGGLSRVEEKMKRRYEEKLKGSAGKTTTSFHSKLNRKLMSNAPAEDEDDDDDVPSFRSKINRKIQTNAINRERNGKDVPSSFHSKINRKINSNAVRERRTGEDVPSSFHSKIERKVNGAYDESSDEEITSFSSRIDKKVARYGEDVPTTSKTKRKKKKKRNYT